MFLVPLLRLKQLRPTVEVAIVLATVLPLFRGLGQAAVGEQRAAVLVNPAAQAGPPANQRFVRHVHLPRARHQQPRVCEPLDDWSERLLRVALGLQFAESRTSAGILGPFSWPGQPQQDTPCNRLLL